MSTMMLGTNPPHPGDQDPRVISTEASLVSKPKRTFATRRTETLAARTQLKARVSLLLALLAVVGVPAALVIATGGPSTIGFWLTAIVWIPVSFFGAFPFGMMILAVVIPVLWLIERYAPGRAEAIVEGAAIVFWLAVWAVGYVLGADLGIAGDVNLPTPWTNVGALVTMAGAAAASFWLFRLRDHLLGHPRPAPLPILHVPEPDGAFWSNEVVEAWRAWTWSGASLHGVYARWDSDVFVAECDRCEIAPAWNHSCGIYAVKDPGEIDRMVANQRAIGRVELWGDVIEHEDGYRASHARITEVWVSDYPLASEIAARYPDVAVRVGRPAERIEVA